MSIKRFLLTLFFFTLSLASHLIIAQNEAGWKEVDQLGLHLKNVCRHPDIEVFSAPNIIMIKVNKDTDVRLFSILGKIISEQHLHPGFFKYDMNTPGVYIIKTNISSCKIAI